MMGQTINISDIRKYILPEVPGCPLPLLDQVIIDVWREFCNETQAWKCDLDPINVRDTVTEYELDAPNNYSQIIVPTKVQIFRDEDSPIHPDAQTEEPYDAYTRFDKCAIILVLTPSEDITNGLRIRVALRPRLTATLMDQQLFEDTYDYAAFGVKARLMLMPKKDWSAQQMGLYYQQRYWDGVGKARIDETRQRLNRRVNARARFPWVGRGSHWL